MLAVRIEGLDNAPDDGLDNASDDGLDNVLNDALDNCPRRGLIYAPDDRRVSHRLLSCLGATWQNNGTRKDVWRRRAQRLVGLARHTGTNHDWKPSNEQGKRIAAHTASCARIKSFPALCSALRLSNQA